MPARLSGEHTILDRRECQLLWTSASLEALRVRRRDHEALQRLLAAIYSTAVARTDLSAPGHNQTDIADTEKAGSDGRSITVPELARMVRVSERTIRRDIAAGRLHATKLVSGPWLIATTDADNYRKARA